MSSQTLASFRNASARLGDIRDRAAGAADKFNELTQSAQTAMSGLQSVLSMLTRANNEFEKSVIATSGLLGSAIDFTDALGTPIANARSEILALRQPVEDILKRFEETALTLSGVTSGELVTAFQAVSRNFSDFRGQSKQFIDDFKAAEKVAERFTVASKALNLPTEQLTQEIRSFAVGDIGPDSVVATSLGFTSSEIKRLKAQGELVDEFLKRTETLNAAAGLGAQTFEGASSNISDFFQVLNREVTKGAFEQFTGLINDLFAGLQGVREPLQFFLKRLIDSFGKFVVEASKTVGYLLAALAPVGAVITEVATGIFEVLALSFQAVNTIVDGIAGAIASLISAFQEILDSEVVSGAIDKLVSGADSVARAWAKATGSFKKDAKEFEETLAGLANDQTDIRIQENLAKFAQTTDAGEKQELQNQLRADFGASKKRIDRLRDLDLFDDQDIARDQLVEQLSKQRKEFVEQAKDIGINDNLDSQLADQKQAAREFRKLQKEFAQTDKAAPINLIGSLELLGDGNKNGALSFERDLSTLESRLEKIQKLSGALGGNDRKKANQLIEDISSQIAEAKEFAENADITVGLSILDPKLSVNGELEEQIQASIDGAKKKFEKAQRTGRGDSKSLQIDADTLVKNTEFGQELGTINSSEAAANFRLVAQSDFIQLDKRIEAFGKYRKAIDSVIERTKVLQKAADTSVELRVESGELTQSQAEIEKTANAINQLNAERRELEKSLASAPTLSAAEEIKDRLSEIGSEINLKNAQQARQQYAAQLEELDFFIEEANKRLGEIGAVQELDIAKRLGSGELNDYTAGLERAQNNVSNLRLEIQKLEQEAKEFAELPAPRSIEEQRALQNRLDANRVQTIEKTTELLNAQLEIEKQIKEEKKRIAEIEASTEEILLRRGIDQQTAQLEAQTTELENQLTLYQAIVSLEQAQTSLRKSRLSIALAESQELAALFEAQSQRDLTRQEEVNFRQLGGEGQTEEQLAENIYNLRRQLIVEELLSVEKRLQREREIFELERKKTDLALKQEQAANRRAQLEAKIARLALERQLDEAKSDDSISDEQRAATVKNLEAQVEAQSEIEQIVADQGEQLEANAEVNEALQDIKEEELQTTQQQAVEEANAAARAENRQAAIDRETFLVNTANAADGQGAVNEITSSLDKGFATVADLLGQQLTADELREQKATQPLQNLLERISDMGGTVEDGRVILENNGVTSIKQFGLQQEFDRVSREIAILQQAPKPLPPKPPEPTPVPPKNEPAPQLANPGPPPPPYVFDEVATGIAALKETLANLPPTKTVNNNVTNNFPAQDNSRAALRMQGF